jgi:AcrR family transcriptional regulator
MALIDAALTLVGTGGLPAIGVRSVTSTAALSSRYFYESFSDSDELMIAALRVVVTELLTVGVAGLEAGDVPEDATSSSGPEILDRFRQGLNAALGVLLEDPRKAALIVAASAGSPRLRQELQGQISIVAGTITGHQKAGEIGFDATSALFTVGGMAQLVIAFVSGELPIDYDGLVERLARYTLGVVTMSRDVPQLAPERSRAHA